MNQIKGEKIDRIVRSKIEVLDLSPPLGSTWSKKASWKVIQNKLGSANKTVIIWGFSIAASVSMLLAASINLNTSIFIDSNHKEKKEVSTFMIKEQKVSEKHHSVKQRIGFNTIKKLDNERRIPSITRITSLPNLESYLQPVISKKSEAKKNVGIISPNISIHSGIRGIYPSLGFDLKLYSKRKNFINHSINLGTSTGFQRINYEGSSNVFPITYIQVGYTRLNELTNKGWNMQIGYMTNPDSNVYKNKTMKFTLTKKFSRHIKAGPELIFTNNLSKVYPGISIILS